MPALKKRSWRITVGVAVAFAVAAALVLLYRMDPSASVLAPKCPFHLLTGLDCPGCGSQRAIHSLLHLRLGDAFRYNALMVLSIPFLILLVFASLNRKRLPRLYAALNSQATIWTVFAIIVAWWILRNLF